MNLTRSLISPQCAAPWHGRARWLLRRWVGPGQCSGSDWLIVPMLLWLGKKEPSNLCRCGERRTTSDENRRYRLPRLHLSVIATRLSHENCLIISNIGLGSLYREEHTQHTWTSTGQEMKWQQMLHSCLRVRGYEDKTVNRDNMENEKPHVRRGGFEWNLDTSINNWLG